MKNYYLQSAKIIILGLVVGLGVSMISAAPWQGPGSNPPSGNKEAPINVSTDPQAKGGAYITGTLLDINGLFTANDIAVANRTLTNQLEVLGNAKIESLNDIENSSATFPAPVCANSAGYLVLCAGGGGGPTGNTQTYTINGSGIQTTSGACVMCTATTFYVDPSIGGSTFTVKIWGAGGGGGAGAPHTNSNTTLRIDGGSGTSSSMVLNSTTIASALGGAGGDGGRAVCSIPTVCNITGSGGAATGNGQAGDPGSGPLPSSTFKAGGAGGGGASGEYRSYSLSLASGATYTISVGKGGAGSVPYAGVSGEGGRSEVCPTGGSTTFLDDVKNSLIKTAHATGLASIGGLGGTPSTPATGNAGRGGDGGSTDNCGTSGTSDPATSRANSGAGGYGGRVEISWN
jgi:hypothetical protein